MEKRVKRRKILIDPVFQYRFVKKVTILALLVVVSSTIGTLFVLSLIKRQVAQPDPFSDHEAISLASMPDISWMIVHLWPYFLLGLLLVTVVSALFGAFESFRIAGPEYRMRQILQAIIRGDFDEVRIPLRRKDELEQLYLGIIGVHDEWRGNVIKMQDVCDLDDSADSRLQKLRSILFSFKVGERQ